MDQNHCDCSGPAAKRNEGQTQVFFLIFGGVLKIFVSAFNQSKQILL